MPVFVVLVVGIDSFFYSIWPTLHHSSVIIVAIYMNWCVSMLVFRCMPMGLKQASKNTRKTYFTLVLCCLPKKQWLSLFIVFATVQRVFFSIGRFNAHIQADISRIPNAMHSIPIYDDAVGIRFAEMATKCCDVVVESCACRQSLN